MSDLGSNSESRNDAPVSEVVRGFRLPFEGFTLLRRQRSLWTLAAIPALFSLAALVLATGLLVSYAGELHAWLTSWLPVFEVHAWYAWLWLGPAKLLGAVLGYMLFLVAAGVSIAASLLVASLVAAPFLDVLSRRVESIAAGRIEEPEQAGLRAVMAEAGRSLLAESQRLVFFFSVWAVIFILGMLIPGGQLVAAPAIAALTVLFLPLDYSAYVLDRRRVPFKRRRAWLFDNLASVLGFGSAAFLICLVPGLNALMLPVMVVAGTLLALRSPPR